MEMNGTLDSHGPNKADAQKINANEVKEQEDGGEEEEEEDAEDDDNSGDDENEEEDENEQLNKGKEWSIKTRLGIRFEFVKTCFCACAHVLVTALKKKMLAGKGLPNGGIKHSVSSVVNGSRCSKSTLNGKHTEENDEEIQHMNGRKTGGTTEH